MPAATPRTRTAFLSSTGADLKTYREAVFHAINRLDGWKCVRMEDFGARDLTADYFDRQKVAECDLFVGIVGHRFGGNPPDSKQSYTQREYEAAKKKPRLMFLSPEDFPVAANLREAEWKMDAQAEFRELVKAGGQLAAIDFRNEDQLATKVTAAIRNWEREVGAMPAPKTSSNQGDARKYLEYLHQDTANIEVRGFQTGQREGYRFPIDELYTPLTTLLMPEEGPRRVPKKGWPGPGWPESDRQEAGWPGEGWAGGDAQKAKRHGPVPLQQALANSRVVIVGDPGSGKTTFLRRIAYACCQTLLDRQPDAAMELLKLKVCPFPILISAATLADFIANKRQLVAAPHGNESPEWLPYYLDRFSAERGWGLDIAFFTHKLCDEGALLLFDSLDEAPNPQARRDLARMAQLAAQRFVKSRIVVTSRPAAYGGETHIDAFERVDIGPLDEAAVATFLGNWCRLLYNEQEEAARRHRTDLQDAIRSRPEIADMAGNAVMLTALAVVHWNEKRLPDQRAELYEAVLRWLARKSEERGEHVRAGERLDLMARLALEMHTAPKGKRVEIEPYEAAEAIAPRLRDLPEDERIAAASAFLADEELHSGIVVLRNNRLRFWHQTFQEYLAALALAGDDARREMLLGERKLYHRDWRETWLLLAGVMHGQSVDRMDALISSILDHLGPSPALVDRSRCVGAIGAMLRDLAVTKYRIGDPRWSGHLSEVSKIFDREVARTIDFAVRLEAADLIDPPENEWIRIEGGTFWMGAQKTDEKEPNFDPEADDDEAPVHRVAVRTFEIAKFPVTVREYEAFVDATKQQPPGDWNQQLRLPNRPVVNVSWHDAETYSRWQGCRLPTEAEWEYAARNGSEGTRHPWGNDPALDSSRANYYDDGPKHPTPVGLYPEGATKARVQDMLGNVWEWVGDWYCPYSADSNQGPASGNYKPLRGGSWFNVAGVARVSVRFGYHPDYRHINLGFRCVREV
jgi:formylglycine-generating enzyme required for sulfatase activity